MGRQNGVRDAPAARADRIPHTERFPGRLERRDTLPRCDAPARDERKSHAAPRPQRGGRVLAPAAPRERLAYLARKIHRLGERPLLELFVELAAGAPLHERLERHAELPADFIAANDGDRLSSSPRSIRGGRNS